MIALVKQFQGNVGELERVFGSNGDDSDEEIEEDAETIKKRSLRGEYRIITQLVGLLKNGKLAKEVTDYTIDHCQHIQNLRTAIYDFKVRLNGLQQNSKKFKELYERGHNYLMRYFYLVVFGQYLIERSLDHEGSLSFCGWLEEHREIKNLSVQRDKIDLW
jgi:hypothetical protein